MGRAISVVVAPGVGEGAVVLGATAVAPVASGRVVEVATEVRLAVGLVVGLAVDSGPAGGETPQAFRTSAMKAYPPSLEPAPRNARRFIVLSSSPLDRSASTVVRNPTPYDNADQTSCRAGSHPSPHNVIISIPQATISVINIILIAQITVKRDCGEGAVCFMHGQRACLQLFYPRPAPFDLAEANGNVESARVGLP